MTKEQALEYVFDYKELDDRTRRKIFDAMDRYTTHKTQSLIGALQKISNRCDEGIYDATDSAFIDHTAKDAIKNNKL